MFGHNCVRMIGVGNSSQIAKCAIALCAVTLWGAVALADDYTLAAGESATFDNGVTNKYGTLNISGDLTVSGNTWLLGTNSTAAVLSGGTVTVEGSRSVFGHQAHGNSGHKDMTLSAGADGKYAKITVRNGSVDGFGSNNRFFNVSAGYLTIGADTEEVRAQYPDGVFHFLDIDGAGVNFHRIINNSSLTGRVTIAGNSRLGAGDGYWEGFFHKGNFIVEVAEGATFNFSVGNQKRQFNQPGCNVKVTGPGNMNFFNVNNVNVTSSGDMRMNFDKGAVIDLTGSIVFDSLSWGGGIGWFAIRDSNVFGPNVGKIKSGSTNYSTVFQVLAGNEITVHDFEMVRTKDKVIGSGAIRIDATAAARTFKATIPTSFVIDSTTYDNNLTIAKYGFYDAEIVATNVPSLRVDEGAVRLTTDCVVGKLQGAPGTKVVADGCTVTILSGIHVPNGLELATANGGKFVKADSGTAYIYGATVLGADIHVSGGDVVFSARGLSQKYWRWTFTKAATSPNPIWLGRLWLFDNDGGHAGAGLAYAASNANLSKGQARLQCDPSATLAVDSSAQSYQQLWSLNKVFDNNLINNLNNYVKLATPVTDPEDQTTYLAVELRLKDEDKPVTGYNIMAEDNKHYPVSWRVEASDDGTTWTEIETRSDVTHANPVYCGFYDGELAGAGNAAAVRGKPLEHFKFSGYKSDGLEADAEKAVSLQVDDGASVDLTAFTVAPQKIGGLTLDMAIGGGTIRGGSIAEDGALNIANAGNNLVLDSPLSLALDGIADANKLKGWTVYVDGVEKPSYIAKVIDGHLAVCTSGLTIIVR